VLSEIMIILVFFFLDYGFARGLAKVK